MNCDETARSVPLYFYGELPPDEEEHMEDHLDGCEDCRAEWSGCVPWRVALDRRRR